MLEYKFILMIIWIYMKLKVVSFGSSLCLSYFIYISDVIFNEILKY